MLLARRGVYTLLHICGDNTPALAEFAKSGADLIEIDHKMDLARCREIIEMRADALMKIVTPALEGRAFVAPALAAAT